MRTLIFGAKGQLGRDLMTLFHYEGEVAGYDLPEVSIADETALQPLVEEFSPDLIINAAAYTDVEGAEEDLESAFLTNEIGARNVAELAAYHQVPVVYYSTDFVFNGEKTEPYFPEDPIDPLNIYGKSKAAGEVVTRKANPHHYILRTAWLYGPGGNNFVEKMIQAGSERNELRVCDDEIGSPTHTLDLAEATLSLVKSQAYGVYHAVNAGQCSRFEQASMIIEMAGLDTKVTPCSATEIQTKAKRPAYTVLDTRKLNAATGYTAPSWEEALTIYMQRRKQ